ncbi:MAG: hypothetical protein U5K70_00935 [Halodesulfurarchaeum sp.]|nr:hypothetical protein [Halodesulfurarchaeum sp.]
MKFEPSAIKKEETEEIIDTLISHVTKSDEEIVQEAEKKRKSTELKVFIADNTGFELGTINSKLQELYSNGSPSDYVINFIDDHTFEEEILNGDVSYLEIQTPKYSRVDQFILLEKEDYLRVLTVERRYWTKRTIERLIRYLPGLDRIFLSSEDLEETVLEEEDNTHLSGFTAKHKPYYSEKELSIQFHGGEESDLRKVESEFDARPTRVEFGQKNSPTDAVKGAVRQDGYYSIPTIRAGSEELGYQTIMSISDSLENHDRANFDIGHRPRQEFEEGFSIEGYTRILLNEESEGRSDIVTDGGREELIEKLEENILDYKQRYKYSVWDDGDFHVFDTETRVPFQVGVEGKDLVLFAKPATTSKALREFSRIVLEEFNSTYSFEKESQQLSI